MGGRFEQDYRLEGRVVEVFWILRSPLLITVDEPGFELAEVLEGLLTMLN